MSMNELLPLKMIKEAEFCTEDQHSFLVITREIKMNLISYQVNTSRWLRQK